jgi:hypothetical protein
MPSFEIIRAAPFSIWYSNPNLASQVRVALAKMAWKTGSNSPVELEMAVFSIQSRVPDASGQRVAETDEAPAFL